MTATVPWRFMMWSSAAAFRWISCCVAGTSTSGAESPPKVSALTFFAPRTAPRPPRPNARFSEVMMEANRTSFSPAGPTTAVRSLVMPCSDSRWATVSETVAPARSGIGSTVTPSSRTWMATNSSLSPTISTAP